MNDKIVTINKLKKICQKFEKERDWMQSPDPKGTAVSITLEAAELLELFQWDDKEEGINKLQDPIWRDKIKMELADIFIYTLSFANQANIDLAAVFEEKLEKVNIKYPAELVKKDPKAYRSIKEAYRKNNK
jgi:dCTP diphosphatase